MVRDGTESGHQNRSGRAAGGDGVTGVSQDGLGAVSQARGQVAGGQALRFQHHVFSLRARMNLSGHNFFTTGWWLSTALLCSVS